MTGRLAFVVLGLLTAIGTPAAATNELSDAEIQGRELAQQLCDASPAESFNNDGVLSIRDGNGKPSSIPIRFSVGKSLSNSWSSDYEIAWESTPVTNGLLIILHQANKANHYELYKDGKLKGEGEILRGNQTMIPFAGSDFWIADLGLEFFHWPEQRILKHEMRRGRSCQVLESTNPDPSPNGYSRVVSWIDNETHGIVQAEAYDAKGQLLKEFYPKTFKKVNGQWELQEMEIRNDQTGSRTRLEFDLKQKD